MKKALWILHIIIPVIVLFLFYRAAGYGFLNWDDRIFVSENEAVKNISFKNIDEVLKLDRYGIFYPVTNLTYAFEYKIFKLTPGIYHLTNIIIHAINAVLVYWFLFLLLSVKDEEENKMPYIVSAFVALFFAVHPLQVEPVVWVSSRKDLLYGMFYLAGLISYLCYLNKKEESSKNKKHFILCLAFFVFSILSKVTAITFPLTLFLVDYFKYGKLDRKMLKEKILFILITLTAVAVGIYTQYTEGYVISDYKYYERMLFPFYVITANIYRTFIPFNLSAIYPYPEKINGLLPKIYYITPIAIVILAYIIWNLGKKSKLYLFGGLFWVITFLPTSQISVIPGPSITYDKYNYLPVIGIFLIISSGVYAQVSEYIEKKQNKIQAGMVIALFVSFFCMCAFASYWRVGVWKGDISLWTDVINKYPTQQNARKNRGSGYYENMEYDKAITDYTVALANAKYQKDQIYNSRGKAYVAKSEYDRAIQDFKSALEINKNNFYSHNNLGCVYFIRKEYAKAVKEFSMVISSTPDNYTLYNNRGKAYYCLKEYSKAEVDFSIAIKLNPFDFEAYYNRALVYFHRRQYDKAMEDLNTAIMINDKHKNAYVDRGDINTIIGQYDKAMEDYVKALKIDGNDKDTYSKLMKLYGGNKSNKS